MDKINVTTTMNREKHQKLKQIAKDRRMNLHELAEEILNWGAEQDVLALYRLGVRVPVFPGELESNQSG